MKRSKRKSTTYQKTSYHDSVQDENKDSNIMQAREESTAIRKIKRGIKAARKFAQNPAEVKSATNEFFFGVTGDKFTTNTRFKTDMGKISKSSNNKMSKILGQADVEFIHMLRDEENHELLREFEEFDFGIETLYTDKRVTKGLLGKDIHITLEYQNNKVRRNIDVEDEVEFEQEQDEDYEDSYTRNLHDQLKKIEVKYGKSAEEIADIFVKVNGDFSSIIRYFEGEDVMVWNYLEDLALTKPEDSMEYKCLLDSKGKEEIEKRKMFLLRTEQAENF